MCLYYCVIVKRIKGEVAEKLRVVNLGGMMMSD